MEDSNTELFNKWWQSLSDESREYFNQSDCFTAFCAGIDCKLNKKSVADKLQENGFKTLPENIGIKQWSWNLHDN